MTHKLPPQENPSQVERDLAAYAPRPPRIDRDRLMFEAGRASSAGAAPAAGVGFALPGAAALPHSTFRWPSWLWPTSTAVMTVVALGLAIALLARITPLERIHVVERIVHDPIPTPPHLSPPIAVSTGVRPAYSVAAPADGPVLSLDTLPENHLLRVRQVALTDGVDALAPPAGRETPRLSPPPTRGALMRAMMPRGSSASQPALIQWPSWLTPELPR